MIRPVKVRRPAAGDDTASPAPRRREPVRRNNPQGLRHKVLDAALKMFQERGYHATSMQHLMQATAVTGGALHHHFPSKKSLALAVFRDRVAPAVRRVWIDPLRSAASLGEGVQKAFDGIIAREDSAETLTGCPLNNLALELALSDPDFREAASEIFGEWQDAIVERLGGTVGGREMTKAARSEVAAFIVSSYSGAMTLAKTQQSTKALRSAASALKRWLQSRQLDR